MRKRLCHGRSLGASALLVAGVLCARPAWGVLNNGFETDWLYASIAWWGDETDPTRGDLIAYNGQTGAVMATLRNFEKWESLTFYGTPSNNDARLFAARRNTPPTSTDIRISELNASGGVVRSVLLRNLAGAPASIGPQLYVGSIRYSRYHGTLFLSLCTDEADPGTALAFEIDLALTKVLNKYTGPATASPPRISINHETGRLYMADTFLNGSAAGDLIEFDTSGGSTSTYSVLINGDTYVAGDPMWRKPGCPIYRGRVNPENDRPTIMVTHAGTSGTQANAVMEFYLDETDANGNLVKRRDAYTAVRSTWQGQMDDYTGTLMTVRTLHASTGAYNSGIDQLTADDVHYRPARNDPVTDVFLRRGGVDVASPGVTAPPQTGGSRIININPRYTEFYPGTPGYENNPEVDALAYHIHTLSELNNSLANTAFGKPIIISDDGYAASDVNAVLSFIAATAAAGEHYEHFDAHIGVPTAQGGGGAMECQIIDGPEDFPADSVTIMNALGSHATPLSPGGTLTRLGSEFHWNGRPVTLMGSDWMGALAGLNFDIEGYLDVLADHGVNLARVWCIEQWTGVCNGNDVNNGILPFAGTYGHWDLTQLNDGYFSRLRQFVQAAWDRGIVIQLSLFDRCGLVKDPGRGVWGDSPYNAALNVNGFLTSTGLYPPFTGMDGTDIGAVNRAFTRRVVFELRDFGNVIYEVMNEPHNKLANQTAWHQWVIDIIRDTFDAPAGLAASIDLGVSDVEDGMTRIQVSDGDTTAATIGGRECRTNVDPASDHYVYFGINQSCNGACPEAYITIDYYDAGTAALSLQYDSSDPAPFPNDIYKSGGTITLTGSNTWKQHTFHVTDAWFGDRQNGGADFRIAHTAAGPFYLDRVSLTDQLPPVPGDFDGDRDVDQIDFGYLQACLSGTGIPYDTGCDSADLNADTCVDQADVMVFQRCVSGSDVAADPHCAD